MCRSGGGHFNVAFAFRSLGIRVVDNPADADLIAALSIGTVRFDPVGGWIADRGILQFQEAKTGTMVAVVRANKQAITPTVNRIVSNMISEIEELY